MATHNQTLRPLLIGILIAAVLAAAWWGWHRYSVRPLPVSEIPMQEPTDIPTAVASAPDGTVWVTLDGAAAIGRIRDGKLERLAKPSVNVEPVGLAVDAQGNAWFGDAPAVLIGRVSPAGKFSSYPLGTPITRLGRMAAAADGAIWFAESTAYSITSLREGKIQRHVIDSIRGGPSGVAAAPDGSVWATLQSANQLLRIASDGSMQTFDVPTRGSGPSDIAVDAKGAIWFLEFRGNKIGRYAEGKFTEFDLPHETAAVTGIAVAPDGAVWFGLLRAHALGRVRDGKLKVFALPRDNARPYSLAADATGNIWYTDISGYVGKLAASDVR